MEKKPLEENHFKRLAEFGLGDTPLQGCRCLCWKAGETILREGMAIEELSIVMKGRAKVCAAAQNGKNLVLCYYVFEGIIGDIELMTGAQTAASTIVAITDFECVAIPYRQNAEALKGNVAFMNHLGRALAKKLLLSSGNYVAAALHTCEERLCAYLLETSHDGLFSDVLTDTACSVGMSYRHMFRLLERLCADGLLEKRACGYRILNREGLLQKAAGAATGRLKG